MLQNQVTNYYHRIDIYPEPYRSQLNITTQPFNHPTHPRANLTSHSTIKVNIKFKIISIKLFINSLQYSQRIIPTNMLPTNTLQIGASGFADEYAYKVRVETANDVGMIHRLLNFEQNPGDNPPALKVYSTNQPRVIAN
jgi:hypothetical protein